MSGNKHKPGKPCCDCKVAARTKWSSYCAPCKTARIKRWKLENPPSRTTGRRKHNPNSCNCGNPLCNGLTCEVVRV